MFVDLVQFMSQLMNLVMVIQIFTHVKFAENKRSWQWEDVSFFAELIFNVRDKIEAMIKKLELFSVSINKDNTQVFSS